VEYELDKAKRKEFLALLYYNNIVKRPSDRVKNNNKFFANKTDPVANLSFIAL